MNKSYACSTLHTYSLSVSDRLFRGTWVNPRREQSIVVPVQEHSRSYLVSAPKQPPPTPYDSSFDGTTSASTTVQAVTEQQHFKLRS